MNTIALIGAGRMGAALLRGWRNKASSLDARLVVVDPYPSPEAQALLRGTDLLNPEASVVGPADVVVLAVKPQSFDAVTPSARGFAGPETVVISVMAGITVAKLAAAMDVAKVVRAMPNTPGAIGMGVTAYVAAHVLTPGDLTHVDALLAPLGTVERIAFEKQMDAVTAISGCGPAYIFFMAEVAAGEAEGLERGLAERLAFQTVIGAGALMGQTGEHPGSLRKAVTSPNGVTAEALEVLTNPTGFPAMVKRAVSAAVSRSKELGK